jgi:hypothetical protein
VHVGIERRTDGFDDVRARPFIGSGRPPTHGRLVQRLLGSLSWSILQA